jgi:hypothetical protein
MRVHVNAKRTMGWSMVAGLLFMAAPALAAFGDGIRVGGAEGRLHPFVELELRYDSNVAYFMDVPGTTSAPGDLILHVRPGLQLSVPGETVAVELRAVLDWAQYMGSKDSRTSELSNLYANATLGVGFNRKGQVGLEIDESYARSDQANVYSIAAGVVSNYNKLTLGMPWRPGGGAMTATLSGDWTVESFDAFKSVTYCSATSTNPFCNSAYLSDLGYNNIGLAAGLNWKFLPKTAALLDLSWFDRIPNSNLYSIAGTGLRAQAGVTGLVTAHLAATLKAGYGTTLGLSLDAAASPQPDLSNFGTWLALASLEWIPTTFTNLKLTFNRDLGVDPGTTWALYTNTHVTLEGKSKLNSLLGVSLTGDLALLGYRDAASTTSQVVTVKPAVQADLNRWLMLELAYQFTDRTTHLAVPPPGWKYTKQEVWLRGVVTY